jgi:adenylate cyclase
MAPESFKRKLTAILSADVKGYSRLMGEDEEGTIRILNAYMKIIAGFIQQHRGRVVATGGDSVLAEFASVVDAVRCGVGIQEELKDRNKELPEGRRMEFRIGINLGDVVEEGDNILGDGVNVAARVQSLAEVGGISISGTAYDHVKNKLALGYDFLGEQTVKNIKEPVRVYRVRMDPEVSSAKLEEEKKSTRKGLSKAALAIMTVLVIAGGAILYQFALRPSPSKVEVASKERMAFPFPDKPSIAVLPFINMSEDPKQEFFSDGLTEDIITALSKHPGLFVIARNSSSAYKGKPVKVRQVAEDLGVQYVLEGSIQRSGDRVRITAQLIDALKGHHIWSERYDRKFKDLFSIQDDITKNIITAVHVKLTDGERARVFAKGTSNLHAYLKATEAQWHINLGSKEGVLRAQQLAEEAIALDPNYAYAHMTLGIVHMYVVWLGMSQSPGDSLKRCIELIQKAVALDEASGEAHALLGYGLVLARQYDRAVAECERGMALEPNSARVLQYGATTLTFVGRREEAIKLFREALRLNPKPPNSLYRHFAIALRDSGQYDESIAMAKKVIEKEPNDVMAYMVLASSYQLAGREEEARAAAGEILRINPASSLERWVKITPHKDRAVVERFIEALRKAGLK